MLIVHFIALGIYRVACRAWDVLTSINPKDLD